MSEFEKILPLYKTAWSELYQAYVALRKIRKDSNGEYIIEATTSLDEGSPVILFRTHELTKYCL